MYEEAYANIGSMMLIISVLYFFYPRQPKNILGKILVHLPLLLIPLYLSYERLMPIEMNIRIDIFLYYPLFFAVGIMYLLRLGKLLGLIRYEFKLIDFSKIFKKGDEID